MEIMKLTIKEDFHRGKHCLFTFSYQKITLFVKKYDIKLITLISMYHLNPFVSLGRFIQNSNADTHIALCVDTVQIFCINTFHRKIL